MTRSHMAVNYVTGKREYAPMSKLLLGHIVCSNFVGYSPGALHKSCFTLAGLSMPVTFFCSSSEVYMS
jgi:hypothetical protein